MIRRSYTRTNGDVRNYEYANLQTTTGQSLRICREALSKGPMIHVGTHWLHDRRFFSHVTVNKLIANGEAVRDGNSVRAI
jgi:hypothetical protein